MMLSPETCTHNGSSRHAAAAPTLAPLRFIGWRFFGIAAVCFAIGVSSVGCQNTTPKFNPSGSLGSRWQDMDMVNPAYPTSEKVSARPSSQQHTNVVNRNLNAASTPATQLAMPPVAPAVATASQATSARPQTTQDPASGSYENSFLMRAQSQDGNGGSLLGSSSAAPQGSSLLGRYPRGPQQVNDATISRTAFQEPIPGQDERVQVPPNAGFGPLLPGTTEPYNRGPYGAPLLPQGQPLDATGLPPNFADIDAFVQEAQSGRFMVGAGFNSDAGVTGQLIIDERNFDISRPPTSFESIVNGQAFRGAGQGFRLEAMPGSQLQRYLVSFSEPYLPYTQISMNVSGYYYDRNFFDWKEQRLGGRVAFGYRLSPDLSVTAATRLENVTIFQPRVSTSPELNAALGGSDLLIGQLTLTHDTRDHAFAPTEGHLFEMSYSQAFGTYDYPRGDLDYRRYFLVRERPDGSGRHTLSFSTKVGVSGAQTPIFENYFAGGVTSMRGFDFRGASPMSGGVRVGGQFQFVNSVEYLFPLTADDMIRGVMFCDFGTVEQDVRLDPDSFRVAPGFGLRVNVPNFGGAPLAFDFAFPVARDGNDDIRNFSFFMGLLR